MDLLQRFTGLFEKLENHLASYEEKTFRRFALLLYVLVAAANVLTHEIWFDEMQHWLIAKDSHSIMELFHNLRYDGHPPLWHLMLYAVSRVTHNPAGMQVLHLAIAAASAYIFLRFAPFTRLQRLLFVFGYFPLYEYAAISRNYAIGLLLIFSFCAAMGQGRGKRYLLISVILFLLCLANAYAFMIAASFAIMLGMEFLLSREARNSINGPRWHIAAAILIVLTAMVLSAIMMIPKPDGEFSGKWTTTLDLPRLQRSIATIWQSFVPIPRLGRYCYWDTNILPDKLVPACLSVLLAFFLLFAFAKKKFVMFLWYFGTVAILVLQYLKYLGYIRHHGHLFILFIACMWLSQYYKTDTNLKTRLFDKAADFCALRVHLVLNVLLVIHLGVGIFASGMGWFCPFSTGKLAARYISENGLSKLPIAGDSDTSTPVISGYLDRELYYPRRDKVGTFIVFDNKAEYKMSKRRLIEKVRRFANEQKSDVLLVLNYDIPENKEVVVKVKEFKGSIWSNENFRLYLFRRPNQ
ncbi:MAG: hypothetical protein ABSG22_03675 [Sedimentisphaerales bacterium]